MIGRRTPPATLQHSACITTLSNLGVRGGQDHTLRDHRHSFIHSSKDLVKVAGRSCFQPSFLLPLMSSPIGSTTPPAIHERPGKRNTAQSCAECRRSIILGIPGERSISWFTEPIRSQVQAEMQPVCTAQAFPRREVMHYSHSTRSSACFLVKPVYGTSMSLGLHMRVFSWAT